MPHTRAQESPRASLAIIIPTLNERENIDGLLERVFEATGAIPADIEVLVADGGSTDGTQAAAHAWSERAPVRLIESDGSGGLAGDVLVAAAATSAETVVVMDGDASHPPEALPDLVEPVRSGTHDMVIGSRYVVGGATPHWPWHRRLISRAATALAWPLSSVRDPMSGLFCVRRADLLSLGAQAKGFKIGLEILARGSETLRVTEVPITFVDRARGTSKMSLREVAGCLRQIAALTGTAWLPRDWGRLAMVALGMAGLDLAIARLLLALGADLIAAQTLSFALAALAGTWLGETWVDAGAARSEAPRGWGRHARLLLALVLAWMLRLGVLESLVTSAGWAAAWALLPAVATSAVAVLAGSAVFLARRGSSRTTPGIRWRVLALSVVTYSLLLRLAFAGVVDLLPEEAYYWNYAQHPAIGYLDHPPMVAWMIWLGTYLAGDSEVGVRLPAIACWLLVAFFMYRLTRNLYGKTAACVALMLVATLPVYFCMGYFMMPDAPLYAAWAGGLFFLERALLARRGRAWIGFGVCLGLGMLSKYTMALLGPAALLLVLADRRSWPWLRRPEPYLAAALAAVLFSPVIVWNANHEWASFAFQGARRWSEHRQFALHILVGAVFILLTPVGAIAVYQSLAPRCLGGVRGDDEDTRTRLWTVVLTVVPLSVFVLHAIQSRPRVNWTGPIWLAALPLVAWTITAARREAAGRVFLRGQWLWKQTAVATVLIFGGLLSGLAAPPPLLPQLDEMQLPIAWEEMVEEVAAVRADLAARTGREPVVIGMRNYFITAQFAFYDPDGNGVRDAVGRGSLGINGLMWDYWTPPRQIDGRDAIVVAFDRNKLLNAGVAGHFAHMEEVQRVPIVRGGRGIGHFCYRIGYDYDAGRVATVATGRGNQPAGAVPGTPLGAAPEAHARPLSN